MQMFPDGLRNGRLSFDTQCGFHALPLLSQKSNTIQQAISQFHGELIYAMPQISEGLELTTFTQGGDRVRA
jgi:hypothetical protein